MAKIYNGIDELIGNTPLLRLNRLERTINSKAKILAKLESFNPAGSAKDRIAKNMLDRAERQGKINKDTVIIEPTSGNTGIGLCMLGALRGYRTVIVMPDSMSRERQLLMKAYGAELVLTNGALGMKGAIAKAEELKAKLGNAFIPSQFENPDNPLSHYLTTAREIYLDTDGEVDFFVAGIGTGGTVSGVGRYLKEKNPNIRTIGAEPADSAVLSGKKAGAHKLQGIGAGFIPATLDLGVVDEIMTVTTEDAYEYARMLAKEEGVLCGISSGAALYCAATVAKRDESLNKTVVVLLPDTGERYLSSELFSDI